MTEHESMRALVSICLMALTLLLSGRGDSEPEEAKSASEFCVEQGGEAEIVEEDGGEVGYCMLSDGTRVDGREYFRENNPDES